uniref:Interleukin 21 receptor n=1 Tax=Mus musculus TaxID=10090 RepID=A0A0U1RP02_MOUSE
MPRGPVAALLLLILHGGKMNMRNFRTKRPSAAYTGLATTPHIYGTRAICACLNSCPMKFSLSM